jgi:hypothetical protein
MKNIGFILITAGFLMFALTGLTNEAKTQSVANPSRGTGKSDSTNSIAPTLPWSPILGTGFFVVGILVVVLAKK